MTSLPVAEPARTRRAALRLIRLDGRAFAVMILLNALAAAAGLAGPWLLGRIIDEVKSGAGVAAVDRLALALLVFALVRLLLSRYASYVGHRFGERTLARIREQFTERALALPVSAVERAGTGDLITRGTTDVAAVGVTLRDAGPEVLIAAVQALFILGAVFVLDPLLGACGLLGLIGIWFASRWYLRRAVTAYLAEGAANSALAEELAATTGGARTVEALRLEHRRLRSCHDAVEECRRTRLHTLFLRSVLFPIVDVSYSVPVVAVLLVGGTLMMRDPSAVTLGTVVAAALYLRQLSQPLDTILEQLERLQGSTASFARVEGLALAPRSAPSEAPPVPADDRLEVAGVRYAYDGGPDVLHGVDLSIRPGERLAIVGPSGAGKTTLGRLLAGMDAPRTGSVTVGGVPVTGLDPDRLRERVILVTQEHHVFLGTVGDNLRIAAPEATDAELRAALAAVGADWVGELPDGLGTDLGHGAHRPDGAQAQQLALARVVLADPHTLILDEATALLDPSTARHTERALAAVLEGRTVVAIAHRLQTAHDADRVAVMQDGRLTELGTHDSLVAADGTYAALWHTWHGVKE
ncbi:ATP-binding cassette, subfamily C [Nonomuraea solani]|uniref:ATP-binding cassette, subfamily C n=1 Tax=Nonomuraea solani TaxID=1144553 RepID=A0A1H6EBL3_9ACTN|nr:ABC transporter ATP-binding protein [Nonomuraea solani]SEG94304.1 ATP-binding cassette, subfamily C [Nonomuraea solani]